MPLLDLTDSSIISRSDKIFANDVGNETVMMSIEAGKYFGTNKTGSYIWKQLVHPLSFAELCTNISLAYNIPENQCKEEIKLFLKEMIKENIIFVR